MFLQSCEGFAVAAELVMRDAGKYLPPDGIAPAREGIQSGNHRVCPEKLVRIRVQYMHRCLEVGNRRRHGQCGSILLP